MIKLGESQVSAIKLLTPDVCNDIGYPSYKLTNNNAMIRSTKQMLEHVKVLNKQITTEQVVKGVRIVDNVEDNRLQFFFPDKPEKEIRELLGANGFRWTPSLKCWQRFRVKNPEYYIDLITSKIAE